MPHDETGFPPIQVLRNVYVAGRPASANADEREAIASGLFAEDGRPDLVNFPMMSPTVTLSAARRANATPVDRALFNGRLWGHFGHFVSESVGRLWGVDHAPQDLPLLWFFDAPEKGQRILRSDESNVRTDFCAVAGISNPTLIVRDAVHVRELHVAPSLNDPVYDIAATPAFQDWFVSRLVGRVAEGPDLYISRNRMPDSAGRFLGEAAIEQGLSAQGYKVIYPEEMSLADQIAHYRAAKRIVLAEGSALHLLAMLDVPGQTIAMIMRRPRMVESIKVALAAFRRSRLSLIERIGTMWGASAKSSQFRAVSELDIEGVWSDLGWLGFLSGDGLPTPSALELSDERASRAGDRKVTMTPRTPMGQSRGQPRDGKPK